MIELLTVGSIMSTIIMQEPPPPIVLLVEGPDDDALLGGHLVPGAVGITCGGRRTVIESVKTAEDAGWNHVFGLVDRDVHPEVDGEESIPGSVAVTTSYDLTADVAAQQPGAVGQAVNAHAHRQSRIVATARGESIENSIYDLATRFAGVRIAVGVEGYPVVLQGFDYRRVLTPDFLTRDAGAFTDALLVRDGVFRFDPKSREVIAAKIEEASGQQHLAGGHDLAGAAFGLVTAAGARRVNRESLERTIRAFANCALLAQLACIRRLQNLAQERLGRSMFDCFPSLIAIP